MLSPAAKAREAIQLSSMTAQRTTLSVFLRVFISLWFLSFVILFMYHCRVLCTVYGGIYLIRISDVIAHVTGVSENNTVTRLYRIGA